MSSVNEQTGSCFVQNLDDNLYTSCSKATKPGLSTKHPTLMDYVPLSFSWNDIETPLETQHYHSSKNIKYTMHSFNATEHSP